MNDWKIWARGLVAAFISSAAHSVSVMVIDPTDFNIHGGLAKLGSVALVSGVIGTAFYLAKSPLPEK